MTAQATAAAAFGQAGADVVLDIRALTLRRGDRAVLDGLSLRVVRGERVALMGLSGEGKTTVLRAIAGFEPFEAGEIIVGGVRLTAGSLPAGETLRALRRHVGLVFQHHHLFEHLSALHNVWLAPVHVRGTPRPDAERRAQALLEAFGVAHRAHALPRDLSGGEAQRVAIARALAMEPPLLLLDEPTAALDPARRSELGGVMATLAASGCTLLVTTHDDDFARAYATRVAVLAQGVVVEEGEPRRVLADPAHPATRRLLQSSDSPAGPEEASR